MKASIRYYKLEERVMGPIEIEVLVPIRTESLKLSSTARAVDRVLDELALIAERYKRDRNYVVEVFVEMGKGKEATFSVTTIKSTRGRIQLYFSPARLRRIGLIYDGTRRVNDVKWIESPEETYVYVGKIKINDENVKAIILDTDVGVRVLSRREIEEYRKRSGTHLGKT